MVVTASAVLAAAALAAGALFLLPLLKPSRAFADELALLDASIQGGYLSTARVQLEGFPIPRGEEEKVRLLKRAFLVSRELGDPGLLGSVAGRALRADDRSRTVRLVTGYALMRSGRLADAEKALTRAGPGATADLLRGESALRRGASWKGSDDLTRDILSLEGSRNPADFEAAAQRTGENRLALDAALLSAAAGNPVRASILARSTLAEAPFDEPAALLAYDAGDFEEAVRRFSRLQPQGGGRADIALLLADSYELLGREGEAEKALRDSLRANPRISWTPYASLGAFAAGRNEPDAAREELAEGRELFPASGELVMESAQLEAAQGNTAEATALLDRLISARPDNSAAALLRLSLRAPQISPEAYRAELWKLFNRVPADHDAFMTLLSSLVAAHDWDGAVLAISQNGSAAGAEDAERLLLKGVVDAMRGSPSSAAAGLKRAADRARDGAARYDLAVVLLDQGNTASALAALEAASGEARSRPAGGSRTRLMARIETLRGTALLKSGDARQARAAFQRALAADPHDLRAGLELRKLEAGVDQ